MATQVSNKTSGPHLPVCLSHRVCFQPFAVHRFGILWTRSTYGNRDIFPWLPGLKRKN